MKKLIEIGSLLIKGVRDVQKITQAHTKEVSKEGKLSFVQNHNTSCRHTHQVGGILKSLIGPLLEVSVTIKGVYGWVLLDTGAQITILYRVFLSKTFEALTFESIGRFGNLGAGSQQIPI